MLEEILSASFMEIIKLDYVKIILFVVLALIIGVCIFVSRLVSEKNAKANAQASKEADSTAETAEEAAAPAEEPEEVVAEESVAPVEEPEEVVAEEAAAPVEEPEEVVAEEAAAPVEEPEEVVAEEAAAPVEEPEEVVAEEAAAPVEEPEEVVAEEAAAPVEEPEEVVAEEAAAPAEDAEEVVAEEAVAPAEDAEEEVGEPKIKGKYSVAQSTSTPGKFIFFLRANNGAILYESRAYASKKSCLEGILAFRRAVAEGEFRIDGDQNSDRFSYVLQCGAMTYQGETVSARSTSEKTVVSVKRFAPTAVLEDLSAVDPSEISWLGSNKSVIYKPETACLVENAKGGKYYVYKTVNNKFRFSLRASNGHPIFESREYASKASCKNGIESFKSAVEFGSYRIDQDKSGRFGYTIQYGAATIQGETVKTRLTCVGTIESVRRFSPTTDVVDGTAPIVLDDDDE